jgi:hypothetical protein
MRFVRDDGRRRIAGVLFVLAWAFWFHHWAPALLVVTVMAWAILHGRLESEVGEVLRRWWRRASAEPWALIALLCASTLVLVLSGAPAKTRILPMGLCVLSLSVTLFGTWWTLVTLPRWLGGPAAAA